MEIKVPIFPQTRAAWFIWVLLLILFLTWFYVFTPYERLYRQNEHESTINCGVERKPPCLDEATIAGLKFEIRAPAIVGDFIEMPAAVLVTNKSTTEFATRPIVVTLTVDPADPASTALARITVDGREGNVISLPALPLGGQANAQFGVRAQGGKNADKFTVRFRVDGKELQFANVTLLDRRASFRQWQVRYLLTPPGSSLVLPLILLLVVSWGEYCSLLAGRYWCLKRPIDHTPDQKPSPEQTRRQQEPPSTPRRYKPLRSFLGLLLSGLLLSVIVTSVLSAPEPGRVFRPPFDFNVLGPMAAAVFATAIGVICGSAGLHPPLNKLGEPPANDEPAEVGI